MILTGALIFLVVCAALIVWAAMQPEIAQPEDVAANDAARAAVIIDAWLKPVRKVKAGT